MADIPADLKLLTTMTRKKMKPGDRKRSRKKLGRRWLYPFQAEKHYAAAIISEFEPIIAKLAEKILESYNGLNKNAHGDSVRLDDWIDEFTALILEANVGLAALVGTDADAARSALWLLITNSGVETYLLNRAQWGKTTAATIGFEYQTPEAWWPTASKAWAQENYKLITSATQDQIAAINELTMRAIRTGMSKEELASELGKLNLMYKNRAELIATDQIGKLNGVLTKNRQTEAGIEFYRWDTANNERVRGRPGGKYPRAVPSHWAMQGMWCKWDDSSVYANPETDVDRDDRGDIKQVRWQSRTAVMPLGIPGEAIRCQCTAAPVWESFLGGIDDEIEGAVA